MIYKNLLIWIVLSLSSGAVIADSQQCKYSIDHDIEINEQKVTFERNNKSLSFTDGQLEINGKVASLNRVQKKAAQDFYQTTVNLMPKIADLAVEGAELGIKAATIAITRLLGDDKEVYKDLIEPIEKLASRVRSNISPTHLNTKVLDQSFDEEFEQELEALLSTAMSKYAGKMASRLISAIFSGDDEEMEDLEFRMENLGNDLESYIESQAGGLEEKAELLCKDFERLAQIDRALEGVKGYPEKGLIQKESGDGFHLTSVDFDLQ